MKRPRIAHVMALVVALSAVALTGTSSVAGPAETAELTRVPSTWPSETPEDHSGSSAEDVISFDKESWVVG